MENTKTQLNSSGNRRGMSPNSRKQLEIGRNKGGRPKDEDAISNILRELGATTSQYPNKNGVMETRTRRELACERLWDIAVHGEPKQVISAMYFIAERTEGKVTQPITPDGEVIFKVIYDRVWDKTPGTTPGTG